MKKNVMMRLACFLLVAVLISTSAISGTYAKYTTQDAGKDEARVAKWGVELQVIGNLYGDTYMDNIVKDADDTGTNIRVQSVDKAADVVAPGTKNTEGFTFSLKGKPEVDGIVKSTMTIQNIFLKAGTYGIMIPVDAGLVNEDNFDEFEGGLYVKSGSSFALANTYSGTEYYTLEDYAVVAADYYPVVYALAGNTKHDTGDYYNDSLKQVADKIAAQLNLTAGTAAADTSVTYTGSKSFETNTDLASWLIDGETLTWEWTFERMGTAEGDVAEWTDKADTILGNLITAKLNSGKVVEGEVVKLDSSNYVALVEYTDYCLDTQFSIDITVTQVD